MTPAPGVAYACRVEQRSLALGRGVAAILVLVGSIALSAFAPGPAVAQPLADARTRLEALRAGGHWAEAESLATAMLRDLGRQPHPDGLAIADVEEFLGNGLWVANQPESALVHHRRSLDLRMQQPARDDTLIADTWFEIGQDETNIGHGRAALAAYDRVLPNTIRVHGPNHPRVASVLLAIADAWQASHDLDRYREFSEQALATLDRSGQRDDSLRGSILSRLAEVYNEQGDLSRAFDAAQAGVSTSQAGGDTTDIIDSQFNLAIILREFGDNEGARAVLSELLPKCVSHYGSSNATTGRVRQTLGSACAEVGDTAQAMRLLRQSERDLLANREPQGSTVALSVQFQADLLHHQKRDREALALSQRAIQLSEAASVADPGVLPYTRYLRLQILESLRDTSALDSARRDLAAIRDRLSLARTRSGSTIAYWLAHADRALGRETQAWDGVLDADRDKHEQLRLAAETLPDSRALELTRDNAFVLNMVLDMADAAHPSRWEVAWDRLIRTRGLVRAELARRRLPAGGRADTAVVRRHDEWVTAKRALARRMVQGIGPAADSAGRAALDRLRASADQTEATYARALRTHGLDTAHVAVGLADVRAGLARGQALVGFAEVQGRDERQRVIAFVARGGDAGIDRIDLGRSDELRARIDPWLERLATSPGPNAVPGGRAERECRRYGVAVRERTWDRIAPHLHGAPDVSLVPDGPLMELAWHALPIGANGYLVETGPTLHLLDAERELVSTASHGTEGHLLAIGDPDFDLARERPSSAAGAATGTLRLAPDPCAAGLLTSFPALPGTGAEAAAVALAWRAADGKPATVLRGAEATEASFKQLAPGCAVLHLATHGVVTGDRCRVGIAGSRGVGGIGPLSKLDGARPRTSNALASGTAPPKASPWMGRRVWLALAGASHADAADRDDNDGLLTADEVVTLDLAGTDWVVLSACHSGLAETWSREGTLGMRRAFELAGANSVIASRWAVDDVATVDWMRTLYEFRAAGETRAGVALEGTCRRVLADRRHAGRSTHPFYWAAFSASGK